MGWDSNPRKACTFGGFQDRCLKPLGHPSSAGFLRLRGLRSKRHVALRRVCPTAGDGRPAARRRAAAACRASIMASPGAPSRGYGAVGMPGSSRRRGFDVRAGPSSDVLPGGAGRRLAGRGTRRGPKCGKGFSRAPRNPLIRHHRHDRRVHSMTRRLPAPHLIALAAAVGSLAIPEAPRHAAAGHGQHHHACRPRNDARLQPQGDVGPELHVGPAAWLDVGHDRGAGLSRGSWAMGCGATGCSGSAST